ncbi:unnamed protein product, partial [marine sediment metagenome]
DGTFRLADVADVGFASLRRLPRQETGRATEIQPDGSTKTRRAFGITRQHTAAEIHYRADVARDEVRRANAAGRPVQASWLAAIAADALPGELI